MTGTVAADPAADGTVVCRYRYRLRVTPARQRRLWSVFHSCRFVWNQALGRWNDLWAHEQVSMSNKAMHAELTDWRGRYDWLAEVPVTPQQQTINDLGRAISAFFDKANPARRPNYRKKGTVSSARWTQRGFAVTGTGLGRRGDRLAVALTGGRVELPVVWSRPLPSPPKSVTVSVDPEGHWWASFTVEVPVEHVEVPPADSGVDLGLTRLAVTVDPSADIPNPRFSKTERRQLARVDARAGRSRRDHSTTSAKARLRRAKAHGKLARRRADHHHRTARAVARSFNEIGVEDLRVKNLMANKKLARHIADAAWRTWLNNLEHQRRKIGRTVEVFAAAGTTQTCSDCGEKANPRLELGDRVFNCRQCGMVRDRDLNAALNLTPGRVRPHQGGPPDGQEPRLVPTGGRVDSEKTKAPTGRPGTPSARIPRL